MKGAHLTAAIVFGLLLAIGCGGAGTDDGSTDASTDGTTVTTATATTSTATTAGLPIPSENGTVAIEGTIVTETNPDPETVHIDPLNVQTGTVVQFQLIDYAPDGSRTVLPSNQWSITAAANSFALLSTASGRLTVGNAASTSQYEIIATYRGVDYRSPLRINGRQANLIGRVVDNTGNLVRGVTLEFFDENGLTVGRVFQPYEGNFFAAVPVGAVSFTVVNDDTLPATFGELYSYNGNTYTVGDRNNPAPIGLSLLIGRNELPDVVLQSAG